MRRAAWVIVAGVISALVALLAAQVLEERQTHKEWLNTYNRREDW